MANVVIGDKFIEALLSSGVVGREERIRRVVIDAQVGHATVMHIECYGDTRVLELVRDLEGVRIERTNKS